MKRADRPFGRDGLVERGQRPSPRRARRSAVRAAKPGVVCWRIVNSSKFVPRARISLSVGALPSRSSSASSWPRPSGMRRSLSSRKAKLRVPIGRSAAMVLSTRSETVAASSASISPAAKPGVVCWRIRNSSRIVRLAPMSWSVGTSSCAAPAGSTEPTVRSA